MSRARIAPRGERGLAPPPQEVWPDPSPLGVFRSTTSLATLVPLLLLGRGVASPAPCFRQPLTSGPRALGGLGAGEGETKRGALARLRLFYGVPTDAFPHTGCWPGLVRLKAPRLRRWALVTLPPTWNDSPPAKACGGASPAGPLALALFFSMASDGLRLRHAYYPPDISLVGRVIRDSCWAPRGPARRGGAAGGSRGHTGLDVGACYCDTRSAPSPHV